MTQVTYLKNIVEITDAIFGGRSRTSTPKEIQIVIGIFIHIFHILLQQKWLWGGGGGF